MKYLLDTNAVIGLVNRHSSLESRIRQQNPSEFGLSVIVLHELYFGAYKGRRAAANLQIIEALDFETVDFDGVDARRAGEIRANLAAAGTPIGPYDVLIAGQAVARDLILITHNTREFARINGLRMENWQT